MKGILRGMSVVAISGLASFSAQAGTATTTFNVTISLSASCVISSGGALAFPGAGVLNTAINGSTTLGVICTNTTPYSVSLSGGLNGTITQRQMKLTTGSALVAYNLYTDNTYATIWGDGTTAGSKTVGITGTSTVVQSTGSTLGGVANGATQTMTVYGQIVSQTTPQPGSYSDTITATVNF